MASCEGVLHFEYDNFLKWLAYTLSEKWHKPYSNVLGWVRVKTQFSIIRAVSLRLRGTRKLISSSGIEDGAGVISIDP